MKNIVLFLSAACLLSTPIFGQQQENRFAKITDPQLLSIMKSDNAIKKSNFLLVSNTLRPTLLHQFFIHPQTYYVLTFCTTAFSADSFWAEAFFCCSSSS